MNPGSKVIVVSEEDNQPLHDQASTDGKLWTVIRSVAYLQGGRTVERLSLVRETEPEGADPDWEQPF